MGGGGLLAGWLDARFFCVLSLSCRTRESLDHLTIHSGACAEEGELAGEGGGRGLSYQRKILFCLSLRSNTKRTPKQALKSLV